MDGAQDQALAPRHATTPLKRGMTGFGGFLITLSGLSPSIGVFIVGSDVLHQTGTGAFVCFLAAVVLGIAMCCVYAELGSAFPHTGGEYTVAGHVLGPAAGFAMLAMNLVGYSIALALSGLGIADYLRAVVPVAPVPTAIAAIASVTMCGVLSIRFNARVTGAFLVVELLALAVTAALGFAHGHGDVLQLVTHPAVGDGHDGLRAVPAVTLCVGAVASIYAFNGYGAVIFLGEEMQAGEAPGGRRGVLVAGRGGGDRTGAHAGDHCRRNQYRCVDRVRLAGAAFSGRGGWRGAVAAHQPRRRLRDLQCHDRRGGVRIKADLCLCKGSVLA